MDFHHGSLWTDVHRVGTAAQPERYALRADLEGRYLAVATNEAIEAVQDPQRAWIFRTHDRAVAAAREIASVFGRPVDVVKLL